MAEDGHRAGDDAGDPPAGIDAADRRTEERRPGGAQRRGPSGAERSAVEELGAYIRNQREAARLSLRRLAKLAGVSNPYLSQIERGLRKPSAEILQGIAKALEISSESLYVRAGILEEREPGEDLEAVVRRDPNLTDEQRQALIEMYRSFRRLAALEGRPARRRGWSDPPGDVDDGAVLASGPPEETAGP